jgi:hypothetical protein
MVTASADADVGIGVSAKSDSATLYIPITAGRFMFEPYVRASDRKSETSSTVGLNNLLLPFGSTSKAETQRIGVGIFRLAPVAERITLYYGGRLARIDEEIESSSTSPGGSPLAQSLQLSSAEGHAITPALGFQFNIIERLSIGGEIGWEHTEADAVNISRSQSGSTQTSLSEISGNDTRAEIILRFFF